jgi:tyrosine-protein phosphatase SIW14
MRAAHAPGRLAADLAGKTAVLILAALLLAACVSASAAASARPAKWAQPVPGAAIEKFFRLNDDIYRSAQPTRQGFEAARALGIASVINLRHDSSDAALVDGLGFNLVEIPMVARTFTEADVVKVLKAIQAAPKPVLVHCMHGADRTGVISAMYRIIFENWTKEEALDELKRGGYGFHWYFFNIPSFIKEVDAAKIREELKTP